MMHNHGTEEGPGLSCNEVLGLSGGLVGSCILRVQVQDYMSQQMADLLPASALPQLQTGENYD